MAETTKKRWKRKQRNTSKCLRCGEEFIESTPWQQYCDDSCRVLAARARKNSN